MTERTLTDADVEAIARAVEERLRGRAAAANERPRAARRPRRVASPEAVERAAERARRYAR